MNSIKTMSDDELRQHFRVVAKMFAVRNYEEQNPGCTKEESWAYAERHWRMFKEQAVDFVTLNELHLEVSEAASWN
jgi:hypothetical protein